MSVVKAIMGGTLAAALMILTVSPASAEPNQNWVQTANNEAGAQYTAYGDIFKIWDNLPYDGKYAYVRWNYKGISDSWTSHRTPVDYTGGYTVNTELVEGRVIYMQVCVQNGVCSGIVETAT